MPSHVEQITTDQVFIIFMCSIDKWMGQQLLQVSFSNMCRIHILEGLNILLWRSVAWSGVVGILTLSCVFSFTEHSIHQYVIRDSLFCDGA